MSLERARAHLARFEREGGVMEFDVSSATVELAARAVGCEPARIAKTLSFAVGDRVALRHRLPRLRQLQQRHRALPRRAGGADGR